MSARPGELFLRTWQPEGEPRADLIVVHGLGEHGGRYHDLARWFTARGLEVTAYDQRGHGKSLGRRGHVAHFQDLVDDLAGVRRRLAANRPGRPQLLYAHSLGALVALRHLGGGVDDVAAAVISAPPLRLRMGPAPWLRP